MAESLSVVIERLKSRPGVLSVTLASRDGLVVESTLGTESDDAFKQAQQFSKVVAASLGAYKDLGNKDNLELVTLRSVRSEWTVTLTGEGEFFFIVQRDAKAVSNA